MPAPCMERAAVHQYAIGGTIQHMDAVCWSGKAVLVLCRCDNRAQPLSPRGAAAPRLPAARCSSRPALAGALDGL